MQIEEIVNFRAQATDVALLQKGLAQLPRVLRDLGFEKMREGQDKGVASIMGGQDTICIFPTSLGKSAVFLIPALCHNWRLLVFSPLKALMRDQVQGLQRKGICALAISSDNKETENQRAISDWVRGDCKILYVAPERLRNDSFLMALRQAPPDMVAVDEAHVLSGWADNFRHSYMFIGEMVERYNPRVVAAFSATMPKEVESDVRRVLRMPDAVKIFHFPQRSNLLLSSSNLNDHNDLFERVRDVEGSALVYCGSQELTVDTAKAMGKFLNEEVGFYHAGIQESVKKMYQDSFLNGRVRVMCATNAFGMGIDKPDIRAVFHLRHPGDPEALSQECGRAGRDGKQSICHTYESREAVRMQERFIDTGHPPQDFYSRVFKFMQKKADAGGVFHLPYKDIQEGSAVELAYLAAILETFHGNRVIESVKDEPKVYKVRFLQDSTLGRYIQMQGALEQLAAREGDWLLFDLDGLASKMELGVPTIRKYLNAWKADNLLQYEEPPRGDAKRIVGDLSLIDFERLRVKKNRAYKKLEYVKNYFRVPDKDKHDYMHNYFNSLCG